MDTINTLRTLKFLKLRRCRLAKFYQKRRNPLMIYEENEFRRHYRFTKENARKLISLVKEDLKGSKRGGKIPVDVQVLAALRYWARNEMQDDCADIHGFSQATMSRISQTVATAFAKLATKFIKMPASSEEQIIAMNKFEELGGLQNIIGAIDCIQLRVHTAGGDDAQLCGSRKGRYSFKVQAICDASSKITDIVACWTDSTNNSRIFNESKIKRKFEKRMFAGILLGDGGYKCTSYVFTPVKYPKNSKDELYNKAHSETQNVIGKVFRLLKSRFRILLQKMRLSRKNAQTLIMALAVLHNLSIIFEEEEFEYFVEHNIEDTSINQQTEDDNVIQNELDSPSVSRCLYIKRHF